MSARMKRYCAYHCRSCGCHFTSLEAFDAHQPRNGAACGWPDEPELVERTGTCLIGDPERRVNRVTLYEHPRADRARRDFAARHSAEASV